MLHLISNLAVSRVPCLQLRPSSHTSQPLQVDFSLVLPSVKENVPKSAGHLGALE